MFFTLCIPCMAGARVVPSHHSLFTACLLARQLSMQNVRIHVLYTGAHLHAPCSPLCFGRSPYEEPFLQSCLRAIRRNALADLRHKARIPLPPSLGVMLMGSPDETDTLGPEEVFLQVSHTYAYYPLPTWCSFKSMQLTSAKPGILWPGTRQACNMFWLTPTAIAVLLIFWSSPRVILLCACLRA